jgi:P4 family phage/plasmid primase-like protien
MDASVTRLKVLADAPLDGDTLGLPTAPSVLAGSVAKGDRATLLAADAADQYMQLRGLRRADMSHLRFYRGDWYRFNGKVFLRVDHDEIKADVMGYLRQVDRTRATTSFQASVIANLHSVCQMPSTVSLPARLNNVQWQAASDWIVVENGIVDIGALLRQSGEAVLSAHTPSFVSTVLLPFAYNPGASCDRWEAFLVEVLPTEESRWLLQEIFGYCLTFDLSQQKFFLLEGGGGNGKGVVLGVLRALLGPENVSSVSLAGLHARFELASTLGKLANISSEADNVRHVDEAVLKQFTGQDAMQFEKKYKDSFSGVPTAKLIIAVNSRPPFRDRSEGLWRRLILLPFPVGIPEERQNKHLVEALQTELNGIFNWAIAGLSRLRQQARFTQPSESQKALSEYRLHSNSARLFLDEYCTADHEGTVSTRRLYALYTVFCRECHYDALKEVEFKSEVLKAFPTVREGRPRGEGRRMSYCGLSLTEDSVLAALPGTGGTAGTVYNPSCL